MMMMMMMSPLGAGVFVTCDYIMTIISKSNIIDIGSYQEHFFLFYIVMNAVGL